MFHMYRLYSRFRALVTNGVLLPPVIAWQLGKVQTLRSHQHAVGLRQATGMEHATVQAGAKVTPSTPKARY